MAQVNVAQGRGRGRPRRDYPDPKNWEGDPDGTSRYELQQGRKNVVDGPGWTYKAPNVEMDPIQPYYQRSEASNPANLDVLRVSASASLSRSPVVLPHDTAEAFPSALWHNNKTIQENAEKVGWYRYLVRLAPLLTLLPCYSL